MKNTFIIAFSTRKGGVLKTSLTVNVAGVLSRKYKVLIVDTDAQGDCLLSFGKNPDNVKNTLFEVLTGKIPAEKAVIKLTKNIDIIPANDRLESLDFKVIGNFVEFPRPFDLMCESLSSIAKNYDFVLVDSPAHFGLMQGNIIKFVDKLFIPFQPETYSMRSLVKILSAISEFKQDHGAKAEVGGVIATIVDTKTVLHSDILAKCRQFCQGAGITLFETVIPKSIRFASSVAYGGLPSTLHDPDHPTSRKYFDLYQEIREVLKYG